MAVEEDFTWVDSERLVRYGPTALSDGPALLAERGFHSFTLLATERSLDQAPDLSRRAGTVLEVPRGSVPKAAAAVLAGVPRLPVVGLGGGRVVDVAKAIAATNRMPCAAVPTTLSGAEMTRFHRDPEGVETRGSVRPSLVIAAPELMASQPMPDLGATAMNALAHAIEALYVQGHNPVADLAAMRAVELIAGALAAEEPERADLALGALLAGYAVDATGYGVHHVVAQTTVRVAGVPHAAANAIVLPHALRLMEPRAPEQLGRLAVALGATDPTPARATALVSELAGRAGATRLSELGIQEVHLGRIASEASARPQLDHTPDPPGEGELLELLRAAL